jgi:hypothetical protein
MQNASAEASRAITEMWSAVPVNEAVKAAGSSFVATATEYQKQTADFITARLEKDREAIAGLVSSKTPAEAMQIQSAWLQQTAQDYSAAATRMFDAYASFLAQAGRAKS